MNNNNRYGNLLDKYLDKGKNYTNLHLSREKQKYTKEEEEKRYGDFA